MKIGVIAPSSGLRDARLHEGIRALERRGYQVELARHLFDRHGYLGGIDACRAADVQDMFGRRDIDAVMCAAGGYGAMRTLDHIDWDIVRANPKLFIGYSDITTLHLALERHVGMVTIHGPTLLTIAKGLSDVATKSLWMTLESAEPAGHIDTSGADVIPLVPGMAEGRLAGGCLELLASAIGTPEEPDFTGRIVLIEDIGEQVYRIDRRLVQLIRCGILGRAAGFVIGTVTGWEIEEGGPSAITLLDVWRGLIAPLGKPTVLGFPFGHEPNPRTLPLGCMARLDATSATFEILEPAVR